MSGGRPELDAAVAAIREEYARRAVAPQCAGSYSFFDDAHAQLVFEREAAIRRSLARHLHRPLEEADVLDVGCSSGISLALLVIYGADARRLCGVDIDAARIERGRSQFPAFDLRVINGHELPYDAASFDLVQQITVLSSVHSPELRTKIASEMLRVLRPGGLVLSYDVAPVPLPPRLVNRALALAARTLRPDRRSASGQAGPLVQLAPVSPITADELRALFPGVEALEVRRLTPYRPLVERVAGRPLPLALLGAFPTFSSALLYVGRKAET